MQQWAEPWLQARRSTAACRGWITPYSNPTINSPDTFSTPRPQMEQRAGVHCSIRLSTAAGWITSTRHWHSAAGGLPCCPLSLYYSPDLIATARSDCLRQRAAGGLQARDTLPRVDYLAVLSVLFRPECPLLTLQAPDNTLQIQ